jgi:hypothetical protein
MKFNQLKANERGEHILLAIKNQSLKLCSMAAGEPEMKDIPFD